MKHRVFRRVCITFISLDYSTATIACCSHWVTLRYVRIV